MASNHFDYLVIGGGSGGVASARRAAGHGANVALVERAKLGGTCVNVGCVPKKVMWNAAHVAEILHDSKHFGFTLGDTEFSWSTLRARRDAFIKRLNGVYDNLLDKSGVQLFKGDAKFTGERTVAVTGPDGSSTTLTADHVLLAVGGMPRRPNFEGAEHVLDSDGFFELDALPKRAAIIGAGYIAVEFAGMLQTLGTEVTLFANSTLLSRFDPMVKEAVEGTYKAMGMTIHNWACVDKVVKDEASGLHYITWCHREAVEGGDACTSQAACERMEADGFDVVISAIGRVPETAALDCGAAGVRTTRSGHVEIADWATHSTHAEGVHAIGDAIGKADLTPVAIAAGRLLADKLYDGLEDGSMHYDTIPSVVFAHPPVGTIGCTEAEARAQHGDDNIKAYTASFTPLWAGPWDMPAEDKPKMHMKLICAHAEQRVVGLHVVGDGADEMLQGFGVAMRMGATKADFDSTVAIHPTSAEEFVTMQPWSPKGPKAADLAAGTPSVGHTMQHVE